jgi:8-oxo-dGTP pyrophosphatase MutT (NUDIX family)
MAPRISAQTFVSPSCRLDPGVRAEGGASLQPHEGHIPFSVAPSEALRVNYSNILHKGAPEAAQPRRQYAALPWRLDDGLDVLLISSRDTRRWVIPKGWPMKGLKPHATAALEALEEAGLQGKIEKSSVGFFHYLKRLQSGPTTLCRVEVFPMRVLRQRKHWPEQTQRVTQWLPYAAAAERVAEQELRDLILAFGEQKLRRLETD